MTMDVYAQLEQRAKRQHGKSFDQLVRRARRPDGAAAPTGSRNDGPLRLDAMRVGATRANEDQRIRRSYIGVRPGNDRVGDTSPNRALGESP